MTVVEETEIVLVELGSLESLVFCIINIHQRWGTLPLFGTNKVHVSIKMMSPAPPLNWGMVPLKTPTFDALYHTHEIF